MNVVLLSDIHGNLVALEAALQHCRNLYGSDVKIICLGDVVGYGPNPVECLRLLKEQDIEFVLGNHEAAVLNTDFLEVFKPIAAVSILWTKEQLESDQKGRWLDFLRSKNELIRINFDGLNILLTHASPQDPTWTYLNIKSPFADIEEAFESMRDINIAFIGHTHEPLIFSRKIENLSEAEISRQEDIEEGLVASEDISGVPDTVVIDIEQIIPTHLREALCLDKKQYIVNCGSVGLPRDSDIRACYVALDTEKKEIFYHRVEFDNNINVNLLREIPLYGSLLARHFSN